MSKHDVERAREALNKLGAKASPEYSGKPNGVTAAWCAVIDAAIDLLEHQTERVMELECRINTIHSNVASETVAGWVGHLINSTDKLSTGERRQLSDLLVSFDREREGKKREVERLNTIIERDANATELIAKKLCDKEREVERLHQKSDAWREEYRKMQEDGWRFEWYDQDEWVYGDWVFDPDCGGKDSYRIAHGPILEGWEYAGYKLAKAGEKWWDDLCDGWITCRCDHEGKTALSHCIRRKEPVDIPPNESDIGKPVMMRDADNMTWIKKTLALIGPNSMTYRYLSSFHDVPYSYRGFKQARKCREGE